MKKSSKNVSTDFNNCPFDSVAKKRISFILATKNRAKFLDRALKSFYQLVTKKDELIIIDGASSDKTHNVIKKHKKLIDICISEEDHSEGHALNKSILIARGKYIKMLTDDDIFYPDAVEKGVQVMEKKPEIDVLLCGGTKLAKGKTTYAYAPPGVNYGSKISDVFDYGGCGIGLLVKRSAFALTGLFNINAISVDTDYLAQAIASGAVVKFCRIKMFHHKIYSHSGVVKKRAQLYKDVDNIKKRYGIRGKNLVILLMPIIKLLQTYTPRLYTYLKKHKVRAIKPVWDGGFS